MGDNVERAAEVIAGFGGDLIEHADVIAKALADANLLAAPVDMLDSEGAAPISVESVSTATRQFISEATSRVHEEPGVLVDAPDDAIYDDPHTWERVPLAAPVDGELREVLTRELFVSTQVQRALVEQGETRPREHYEPAWDGPGEGGRHLYYELIDAMLPRIAAHVAERERKLREEIAVVIGIEYHKRAVDMGEADGFANEHDRGHHLGYQSGLRHAAGIARRTDAPQ